MNLWLYILGVLTIFTLLVYIIYARSLVNGLRDNDGFFHLVCAREFCEACGIPKWHAQYLPGRQVAYTYPPALHALLALFVDWLSLKILLLFPLAATLMLTLVVGVGVWIMRGNWADVALGMLIFLATPSNIKGTLAITPRHLGILFFFMFFVLWPAVIPSMLSAALARALVMSLMLALLLLSHRMGAQLALLCTGVLLGFGPTLGHASWATGCWAGGLALAVALSGGQYIRVLRDHIQRLKLHFVHGPQSGERRRLGRLRSIITYNPFILLAPLMWWPVLGGAINLEVRPLVLVVLAILAASIFWIWGSGERHMIFLAPFMPLLILQSNVLEHYPVAVGVAVALALALSSFFACRQYRAHLLPKDTLDVFEWVRLEARAATFAILPRVASPAFVFFSKKNICAYPHDAGAMEFNRLTLRKNLLDPNAMAAHLRQAGVDGLMVQPDMPCTEVIEAMGFVVRFRNRSWLVAERGVNP